MLRAERTETLPSELTAWEMTQAHPQVLSSDAVSARTEVGTQPLLQRRFPFTLPGEVWDWGMWKKPRSSKGRQDTRLQKGHELRKQPVQRPRDEKEKTELGELQADWPGWSITEPSCIYYLALSNPSLPTSPVLSLWIYLHFHCHPPN